MSDIPSLPQIEAAVVQSEAFASRLPSFLAASGPGRYTLTMSASAAETVMLCPAKYSWSRITGIEAAAPRAGMNYGKALHLALAHRYSHVGMPLEQAEAEGVGIMAKWFEANPQPTLGSKGRPEWRTLARAAQALHEYNTSPKGYPAEDFEVVGVEEPFEVVLGEFTVMLPTEGLSIRPVDRPATVTVVFRGIRDLRVKWHDQLWVLDHKTSTEWSDLTVDEGRCSFQFQGYQWVERLLARTLFSSTGAPAVIPVGGVIGNYLISREPYSNPDRKPTPRDLPRDQFERQAYPYSDAQLDEWHDRDMGVARDIWRQWSEGEWPQRSTACAHWGKCEYYRLCWETDPGFRLAAALSADYRPRTPSPFEDEANGKERT